jgi:uncharacterized protein (TIGR02391 family)
MEFYEYLHSVIPDPEDLIRLSVDDLGALIIEYAKRGAGRDWQETNTYPVGVRGTVGPYPIERRMEILQAVTQARTWLVNEQFATLHGEDYIRLTEKARQTDTSQGMEAYRQSKILSRDLLHPRIADRAWDHFQKGRYDDAILAAFKEIEVAVRTAGGFGSNNYGVALMNAAFNPNNGRLHDPNGVDPNATPGELTAWANLFAGAIGVFKNPQSHRWVGVNQAVPAMEALVLASLLYRLLEVRLTALGRPLPP